jgi:hypothetical protein
MQKMTANSKKMKKILGYISISLWSKIEILRRIKMEEIDI